MDIKDIAKERVLILDGAMGTMIQKYGLTEEDFRGSRFADATTQMKGNNDMLNITCQHIVEDIHRKYLEAGADIISTNTFSSQRISQADYHLEDHSREMAFEGARIAKRVAEKYSTPEKPRFVAGSVGPTNKTLSMSPDVSNPARRDMTYDQLFSAYSEQMEGLIEGGADIILIETIFDTLNAKVAIDAALTGEIRKKSSHNALRHGERPRRKNTQRTDSRCLHGKRGLLPYFLHRTQLLLRRTTDETFHCRTGKKGSLVCERASQRRTAKLHGSI